MSQMKLDRRGFICALSLSGATALWPALAISQSSGNSAVTYGMIEIGSSGVKVSAYQFSRDLLGEPGTFLNSVRFIPKRVGQNFDVNTNVLSGTQAAIAATIEQVVLAIERLQSDEFRVAPANITIVMSSGVATEEHFDRSDPRYEQSIVGRLRAGISARFPYEIREVTPAEEARLGFDWVVLTPRRREVLLVDIGSGNTKGGYYENAGLPHQRFRPFSLPFGTKTFATQLRSDWPDGPLHLHSQQAFDTRLVPELDRQIAAAPGLMSKPRVYMVGGIVWAVATLMHPRDIVPVPTRGDDGVIAPRQPDWVRLSPVDFSALRQRLVSGLSGNSLASPVSPRAITPAQREWLDAQLSRVGDTFSPEQLLAGVEICIGLSRRLNFSRRAALFFATFSVNAWSSQYLIERFGRGGVPG